MAIENNNLPIDDEDDGGGAVGSVDGPKVTTDGFYVGSTYLQVLLVFTNGRLDAAVSNKNDSKTFEVDSTHFDPVFDDTYSDGLGHVSGYTPKNNGRKM